MRPWQHDSIFANDLFTLPGFSPLQGPSPSAPAVPRNRAPEILSPLKDSLRELKPALEQNKQALSWLDQLAGYIDRIEHLLTRDPHSSKSTNSKAKGKVKSKHSLDETSSLPIPPTPTPQEQFDHLHPLRKWLFWVPISLLSSCSGSIELPSEQQHPQTSSNISPAVLAELAHYYSTACTLEQLYPEVTSSLCGNMAIASLERILRRAARNPLCITTGEKFDFDLVDFPRQAASSFRSRRAMSRPGPSRRATILDPLSVRNELRHQSFFQNYRIPNQSQNQLQQPLRLHHQNDASASTLDMFGSTSTSTARIAAELDFACVIQSPPVEEPFAGPASAPLLQPPISSPPLTTVQSTTSTTYPPLTPNHSQSESASSNFLDLPFSATSILFSSPVPSPALSGFGIAPPYQHFTEIPGVEIDPPIDPSGNSTSNPNLQPLFNYFTENDGDTASSSSVTTTGIVVTSSSPEPMTDENNVDEDRSLGSCTGSFGLGYRQNQEQHRSRASSNVNNLHLNLNLNQPTLAANLSGPQPPRRWTVDFASRSQPSALTTGFVAPPQPVWT
jgi:hypothetical protein